MHPRAPTAFLSFALALGLVSLPQPSPAFGAPDPTLWLPPLGSPLRISAPFDLPNGPFRAGHRGVDMNSAIDLQVVSPTSGVVSFVGKVVDRAVVSISVDDHTIISFEPLTTSLNIGDTVARGDPLGAVASGGHCASVCLHLGVRVDGKYVNPMRFLAGRAKLVPW